MFPAKHCTADAQEGPTTTTMQHDGAPPTESGGNNEEKEEEGGGGGVVLCYDTSRIQRVPEESWLARRSEAFRGKEDHGGSRLRLEEAEESFRVGPRAGRAWVLREGQVCRMVLPEGPQVGDLNLWNLHQPKKERFYSGKTRQLEGGHLREGSRLWSNVPYLRPMATVVSDSLGWYGVDEDGASVHDVMGTRCDPYTARLLSSPGDQAHTSGHTCHEYLVSAVEEFGLGEEDVHDVFNVFMCTGWTRQDHRYFVKPTPARRGDYLDLLAEMDLILALSACPKGDVSLPVGQPTPPDKCFPIDVHIFRPGSKQQHPPAEGNQH